MKRLIIAFIFLLLTTAAYALPEIPDGFYLENESVLDDSKPAFNVLTNTLRLSLTEGEDAEIYAETQPADGTPELSWVISNASVAEIFPSGRRCTVHALREGSAVIRVSAENSEPRLISVEVKTLPKISLRSFEYEGEPKKNSVFTYTLLRRILQLMVGGGLCLIGAASLLLWKRWKR